MDDFPDEAPSCERHPHMDAWGWRYDTPTHDAVELIVAEPAANAVTHGRVPGRDAELRLGGPADADGGRGLALVATLAEDWGVASRPGAPATRSGPWWRRDRGTAGPPSPVPGTLVQQTG